MRRIVANPFDGLGLPDGSYKAFALAAESDYDQILVNGALLAAGRVLMLNASTVKFEYVRGPRTDLVDGNGTHTSYLAQRPKAAIVAFECGDQIVNPGPRAARRYGFRGRTIAGTAVNVNELVFPFSGRRHFHYSLTAMSVATEALKYCILGRRWPRNDDAGPVDSTLGYDLAIASGRSDKGSIALTYHELAGCGTLAAPLTSNTHAELYANGPKKGSAGAHIGGFDSAEFFDELSFFYWPTIDGNACDYQLDFDIAGEHGVG